MTDITTGIGVIDQVLHWVLGLLGVHGYLITFVATILENLFIIGSAVPGEIVVMAAAFVATTDSITPVGVWIASFFGTVVGSNLSYVFGRKGGRDTLIRYGRRFHLERRLVYAEEYFAEHGSKTVLLARFAAGVKNWVPMLAGVSRMPLLWFELYTVLGAVIYTSLMVVLGYYFGSNFPLLLTYLQRAGYVGLALVVGLGLAAYLGRRRHIRHKQDAAEAEFEARGETAWSALDELPEHVDGDEAAE